MWLCSVLVLCFAVAVLMEKTVLVSIGENNRVVTFQSPTAACETTPAEPVAATDVGALQVATKAAFSDILWPGQTLFFQIKSQEWGGVFIDLLENEVPDKAVIKALVRNPVPEVHNPYLYFNTNSQKYIYICVYTCVCMYHLLI